MEGLTFRFLHSSQAFEDLTRVLPGVSSDGAPALGVLCWRESNEADGSISESV